MWLHNLTLAEYIKNICKLNTGVSFTPSNRSVWWSADTLLSKYERASSQKYEGCDDFVKMIQGRAVTRRMSHHFSCRCRSFPLLQDQSAKSTVNADEWYGLRNWTSGDSTHGRRHCCEFNCVSRYDTSGLHNIMLQLLFSIYSPRPIDFWRAVDPRSMFLLL